MSETFACLGLGALVAGGIWKEPMLVGTGFFFLVASVICSMIGV